MNCRPTVIELKLKCSDGITTIAAQSWKKSDDVSVSSSSSYNNNYYNYNTNGGFGGMMMYGGGGGGQPTSSTRNNNNNNNTNSNGNNNNSSSGLRVLLIHGWLDNCRSFYYMAPNLIQSLPLGSEVIAIDMPGHGLSSHTSMDHNPQSILSERVYYISEVITQLKWDTTTTTTTTTDEQPARSSNIILIGHSFGAQIACLYAATFPEQIHKLILLDGIGPTSQPTQDITQHIRKHILRRKQEQMDPVPSTVYNTFDDAIKARCNAARLASPNKDQWMSDETAMELISRGTTTTTTKSSSTSSSKTTTTKWQYHHDMRFRWPSIQFFTSEQTEAVYRNIRGCSIAIIRAKNGWPRDEIAYQTMIDILKPKLNITLPGYHHFHADPNTADKVSQEVIRFILPQQKKR